MNATAMQLSTLIDDPLVWQALCVTPDESRRMFWALVRELHELGVATEELGGTFLRARQWAVRRLEGDRAKIDWCRRVERLSHGAVPGPTPDAGFSPVVENLAGRVSALLGGWEPDTATINLYRDQGDSMPLHCDGPAMYADRFVTVSLGGPATLRLQRIDDRDVCVEARAWGGWMYMLNGLQRTWLHGVNMVSDVPRLSVTFLEIRARPEDDAWMLADQADPQGPYGRVLGFGTRKDVIVLGKALDVKKPIVTSPRLRRDHEAEAEIFELSDELWDRYPRTREEDDDE